MVVLPVPGPPVMMLKPARVAKAQASFCQSNWPAGAPPSNSCARRSGRSEGGFGLTQALAQGMVDAPFVTPVTAQVKALATAYQRPRLLARRITCGHQRAGDDALKPGIQVKVGQQLRWQ